MVKLFWVAVFALIGIYGSGYLSLSEGAANRFLNNMEELTMDGNAHAICDLLADDMNVSIIDHTTGKDVKLNGGKEELCAQLKVAVPAMSLLKASTNVQRDNFVAKRELLHPWTAQVSYSEKRTTNLQRAGVQRSTESDDKLVLVKTFSGIKIQRLESEEWLAGGE